MRLLLPNPDFRNKSSKQRSNCKAYQILNQRLIGEDGNLIASNPVDGMIKRLENSRS